MVNQTVTPVPHPMPPCRGELPYLRHRDPCECGVKNYNGFARVGEPLGLLGLQAPPLSVLGVNVLTCLFE